MMEKYIFQGVNDNSKTFRLKYDHAQRGLYKDFDSMLSNSVDEALANEQIKPYGGQGLGFDTNARFAQGVTRCQILDDAGNTLATGYSFCAGTVVGDQFRKDRGRGQSRSRAFSLLKSGHGFDNGKPEQVGAGTSS